MFYLDYGYGYNKNKTYKTLRGAKIGAKKWVKSFGGGCLCCDIVKIEQGKKVWVCSVYSWGVSE